MGVEIFKTPCLTSQKELATFWTILIYRNVFLCFIFQSRFQTRVEEDYSRLRIHVKLCSFNGSVCNFLCSPLRKVNWYSGWFMVTSFSILHLNWLEERNSPMKNVTECDSFRSVGLRYFMAFLLSSSAKCLMKSSSTSSASFKACHSIQISFHFWKNLAENSPIFTRQANLRLIHMKKYKAIG